MLGWIVVILGGYALFWSLFGAIFLSIISLGSFKHIIYIDKQLAKNLDKYYDEKGYMRQRYQLSSAMGSRFMYYCVAYPFIRYRVYTDSIKFSVFMWFNSLGYWSWIGVFICMFIDNGLEISH